MALQDLTPQLRTRLSRMERAVGWFVFVATALLIFGFGYYIYHTAERKGWFRISAPFFTYVQSSEGLKIGDDVVMMGFKVGEITDIHPMPPGNPHNVRVDFVIRDNYDSFRYIRTGGSFLKVNSADFLGKRELEVTRGTNGLGSYAVVVTQPISILSLDEAKQKATEAPGHWQLAQDVLDAESNVVFHAYDQVEDVLNDKNAAVLAHCTFESNSIYVYDNTVNRDHIVASWWRSKHHYQNFTPNSDDAYLRAIEPPSISDELQGIVVQVQTAMPNILALTNKLATVLDNTAKATSNLNIALMDAHPMLTNFADISAQLHEPGGPVLWALGTNGSDQLQGALTNVNSLLAHTDTNMDAILIHLSDITSNLSAQVQSNTNLVSGISKMIIDSDDFIQGLKRHWFLRSAFKVKPTNAPPVKPKK